MYSLLLISILAAVALGVPFRQPNAELDEHWGNFKTRHSKAYEDDEEDGRRIIWEDNIQYIQKHNLEADTGIHTFRLGMNKYSDWTLDEFVNFLNGYATRNSTKGSSFIKPNNLPKLPDTVDWRKEGYVTPVKNQEQCGSCWTFSATGSLEGQQFRKTKTLVALSEQNLIDCSRDGGDNGCKGGNVDVAFQYVISNNGIDTEDSYPYTQLDNATCHYKEEYKGATITSYTDIEQGNEEDLKHAVATVGPVSVAIDASQISFTMYKSGVYDEPLCSSTEVSHGVLVVGYGTFEGKDYWLVKNSWGESWGMNGYIMMSRNKNNQCAIAYVASYPVV